LNPSRGTYNRPGGHDLAPAIRQETVMAVYKITSLNSARGSGIKFDKLESLASSFTIDAGAFLISTDSTGVALRGPAAWTATVNGYIAGNAVGLHLNGSLGAAKVVVGESGGVRAVTWGIYANTNATIDNSGFILGQTEGIRLTGTGTNSIINKGTIGGRISPSSPPLRPPTTR
jgi:hypothetical protein